MTTFDILCHAVYHDECNHRKGGEQSSDPLIRLKSRIPHHVDAVLGMEKEESRQAMISMAGKAIRKWWALFALPTFAAFIIGFVVPFIMGVYLSFCKFTTVTDAEFVGLKNYTRALQDKEFLRALGFSTSLTIVTTIVINVVAFFIAYMLTKAI